jgi:hypothetical protein
MTSCCYSFRQAMTNTKHKLIYICLFFYSQEIEVYEQK